MNRNPKNKQKKTAHAGAMHGDAMYKYKLLSYFMDNIPDVIYFKDRKGKLVLVNQAHAKGLGMKPGDVVGKTDFDFFPKNRAQRMAKDDMCVIKTGKPMIDKIERATRPDGIDNYVSTTKIPVRDKIGKIVGLVGITRDITRRMQFEYLEKEKARVEKKLEMLEALNKVKSNFISTVSHELRTPLAIVKQLTALIFDETAGPINDKQREIIKKVENNTERLKKLIDDLLDMSRIERDKLELRYSLVNLNDLLKDSADFYKTLAEEKRIDLSYHLPAKDVNLFIDADRINQAVANFINNAIKFTEEGGKISVEVKVLETKVRVGVIDTGIGIAKSDLPQLFNRFVQVSNTGGAGSKGVGLGLSIVKELIKRHGGEAWIESKLGIGSKFYFTLPRFYRPDALDKDVKDKIGSFLNKGISLQFINLIIVNYKEFRGRIKIGPAELFEDLKRILDTTFRGICRDRFKDLPVILTDVKNGKCSVILPRMREAENARVVRLFKDKIKSYFMSQKVESAFVNIGVSTCPSDACLPAAKRFSARFSVKEVYVGLEMRRFKRVLYKVKVKIFLPENKTETQQTVDISEGGLCFITKKLLKTDSRISIRLEFDKTRDPVIHTDGRVAWIKKVELLSGESLNRYKVGVEFINLKSKHRKIILKKIKP
ncbi:MAG: ATP-binding protein [Candidatus Omnitrophota bacterium]|nr:ATP-binding protein [Candidatus Omnitrophota bacterium]